MIPLTDHPSINSSHLFNSLAEDALKRGKLTKGQCVKDFENKVKEYYDVDYAISFGSGTLALYGLLNSIDKNKIKTKNIFIPAYTWESVLWACNQAGFYTYPMDIHKDTLHIIDENYGNNFIMGMDTYGSICNIGKSNNYVIDSCHSFGVKHKIRGLGEAFSFNGGKMFSTGEGGMVVTNDEDIATKTLKTRDLISRMPNLSAALGLQYFEVLDKTLERRKDVANYYTKFLRKEFTPQTIPIDSNYYMYAVSTPYAPQLLKNMKGIMDIRQYYNPPMGFKDSVPNAFEIAPKIICIPIGNFIYEKEVLNTLNDEVERLVGNYY